MLPGPSLFSVFQDRFWDRFRTSFSRILDPKKIPKISPKSVPESVFFLVSAGSFFFEFQSSLKTLFCSLLGLLGPSWGGLKSEKMQTALCENHFFESRLFGLSEFHLALLGSSRPLPGQSWGPDGTQKTPRSNPKSAPKMD